MFKGLHPYAQKIKAVETVKHPSATAILTADTLLGRDNCQQHLTNIKSLLNLPPKLFDTLYYKPIKCFAEFVQSLPQTRYGAFSNSGGFLDHGIERAARAISLCLTYFFPQEKTLQMASSQEALWIYAVFTASLFLDLGKLAVKYHITICNKDSSSIREWLPYSGSMSKQGNFYKYDFIKENRDHLGWMVTSLLARQLLNEAAHADTHGDSTANGGFNWIASDPQVLEAWLRMLSGDHRGATSFMTVIPLADAQIIEQYLNSLKVSNAAQPAGIFTNNPFFDGSLPNIEEAGFAAQAGAIKAFLDWLDKAIATGAISKNTDGAMVREEKEGVLLSSEIFDTFVAANPRYQNGDSIKQQFMQVLELYTTSVGELAQKYSYLQGNITKGKNIQWLLVTNPRLLFETGAPGVDFVVPQARSQNTHKPQMTKPS